MLSKQKNLFAFAEYVKERLALILHYYSFPYGFSIGFYYRYLEPNKELKTIKWYESVQWRNQFLACINFWPNNHTAWTGLAKIDVYSSSFKV